MKKLLSLLLALTMILPLVGCVAFAENADPIMITVIATSDVHGKVLPINYATGEPSPNVGLSMIASMIEQVRATEKNVILVDGGDTVQGSAMTYYYSYFAPEKDDPMMKALRLMDYDMWCLGNHEFNNDLPILKRQIEYVMSPDNGEEHSVPMSAANFVAKGTEWDSWMGVPYIVKEFEGVKVGVIGMDTPNIPAWEVESHYGASTSAIWSPRLSTSADPARAGGLRRGGCRGALRRGRRCLYRWQQPRGLRKPGSRND